jgi:hypothetical protein
MVTAVPSKLMSPLTVPSFATITPDTDFGGASEV